MKINIYYLIFIALIISSCSSTTGSNTSENAPAVLAFNIDEVHLRSVDGKPFIYNPINPFASNRLNVSPGKHIATVTLHWVGSLDGRSFSVDTEESRKNICFIAEAGKTYVLGATFTANGDWAPKVEEPVDFFKSKSATLCK